MPTSGHIFRNFILSPVARALKNSTSFQHSLINKISNCILVILIFTSIQLKGKNDSQKAIYLMDSISVSAYSKSDKILLDSSMLLYHKATSDTGKINALDIICENMNHNDWIKFQYFQHDLILKSIQRNDNTEISRKLIASLALAKNNIGFAFVNQGRENTALKYFMESLALDKKINNRKGIAGAYNNIGYIYKNQGRMEMALTYYHQSLLLHEELNMADGIASATNNIGHIYEEQNLVPEAIEYYLKSKEIYISLNNKIGEAKMLNNLANASQQTGDLKTTLSYLDQAIQIHKLLGNRKGMAQAMYSYGWHSCFVDSIERGMKYMHQSEVIFTALNDASWLAYTCSGIGEWYFKLNDQVNARKYGNLAIHYSELVGIPERLKRSHQLMFKIRKRDNAFKSALKHYEVFITMSDSINNTETQKSTIRQQTKYEFEKAQLVEQQAANEVMRIKNDELSRRDNLQYSIILIALLLVFGGVLSIGFIKVSPKVAEGLIFFSFLILFEFVLVLADPYIEKFSGGGPGYKLLFNAGLAGCIFPIHSLCERVLKARLIQKIR